MTIIVAKFGGTSVGSVDLIQSIAKKIIELKKETKNVVVVLSAMAGKTKELIDLVNSLEPLACKREVDNILATGEQVSTSLLAIALQKLGVKSKSLSAWQVVIKTNDKYSKARIENIDSEIIQKLLEQDIIPVITGFQGIDENNNVTTLGRGGSDTSAVAIACALKAKECLIYTDVDGVFTTDPKIVKDARKLSQITFEEMLELSSLGAKVLQIRAVEFAGKYNMPLRVLSSFSKDRGTLITYEDITVEKPLISGIAFSKEEAKISLLGIKYSANVATRILEPLAKNNIDVDIIVQNFVGKENIDFTFTVNRNDFQKAKKIIKDLQKKIQAKEIHAKTDIVTISVVGVGMKSHSGIAFTMFETLSKEGVFVELITTSEIKVTVLIDEKYLELAVRSLHNAFNLSKKPEFEKK